MTADDRVLAAADRLAEHVGWLLRTLDALDAPYGAYQGDPIAVAETSDALAVYRAAREEMG